MGVAEETIKKTIDVFYLRNVKKVTSLEKVAIHGLQHRNEKDQKVYYGMIINKQQPRESVYLKNQIIYFKKLKLIIIASFGFVRLK